MGTDKNLLECGPRSRSSLTRAGAQFFNSKRGKRFCVLEAWGGVIDCAEA